MKHLVIKTIKQHDCTIGTLNVDAFRCFTLELPWKDNQTNVSCIPAGHYNGQKITSPSLGECLEIKDVLGRSYIRIHAGNYTRQIRGCILVGESLADIDGDSVIDVTNSKSTLSELMDIVGNDEFLVTITRL